MEPKNRFVSRIHSIAPWQIGNAIKFTLPPPLANRNHTSMPSSPQTLTMRKRIWWVFFFFFVPHLYELEDIWTSARASPKRNRALESKAAVDGVNRSERPPRHQWRKSGAIAHRFPPLAAERRRRRLHPRRRFWGGWKGKKTSQSTLQEGHFCKKSY